MKNLALAPALLAALPAAAHDAGPIAHAHPHGMEGLALALGVLAILGYALWRANNRS